MSITGDVVSAPIKVDRKTTTPFLLKLFYRQGGFHRLDDFRARSQPNSYVTIYTWRDCTLSELSMLLSSTLPAMCPPRSRVGFRLIYADTRYGSARYTSKDLGAVVPGGDAALDNVGRKTLSEVAFVVGDWIDVAVYPEGHGGVGVRGVGGGGFGGVGRGRGRGVPVGEWRRGERVEGGGRGRARRGFRE
ncbi:uncharacterized protein H6S33_011649 [Morchella sextelata]|uniref:uncharacterized protein n=1 Tax=Morchella sextelata TaxID=1174677 RepID=UPI001D057CA2|nr:uncharacterized protein H6S33_011649 [Morchella sextelata]KAH0611222.1 hypothetical protein H6S33_011649 [Morchella sextelata]